MGSSKCKHVRNLRKEDLEAREKFYHPQYSQVEVYLLNIVPSSIGKKVVNNLIIEVNIHNIT